MGQGCTGCNHSHSQASGSQACSPRCWLQAARWKDRGDPSLAFRAQPRQRDLWPAVPVGDWALAPRRGPCSGLVGKVSVFWGHCCRLQPLPGGACKKGPLTPTSLEIWAPGSQPPGPPVTAWSFPWDCSPSLLSGNCGKAWEVSVVEGEMLPQIVEMDQAEGGCSPDSRDGPGRGRMLPR